jgi:hypothetical protein
MPIGAIADIDEHRVKFTRDGFKMIITLDYLEKLDVNLNNYFKPAFTTPNSNQPIICIKVN